MTRQAEHADRTPLAQQRRADHAAIAAESLRFVQLVFRIGLRIENLDSCALEQSSTGHTLTPWLERYPLQFVFELCCKAVVRLVLKIACLVWTSDLSDIGLAKSDRRLYQSIKHCLQIKR